MRIVENAKTLKEMRRLMDRARRLYCVMNYNALTDPDIFVRRENFNKAVENVMASKLWASNGRNDVAFSLINGLFRHNKWRHGFFGQWSWWHWQKAVGYDALNRQPVPVMKVAANE